MQEVYIVAAKRSALTKAKTGAFSRTRPDDLLAQVIKEVVSFSKIKPEEIEDVIIGCAFPEAEQGLNIARMASLLADLPESVPGITLNRYCSSGLNSISMAANRIKSGEIEVAIAGGVESMSMIPMGGNKFSLSPLAFSSGKEDLAYNMGITAEKVAQKWQISREAQDEFALNSHQKAIYAQQKNWFLDEILPIEIITNDLDLKTLTITQTKLAVTQDEGIRLDTSLEALANLKPVFATNGTVTAGNSSQLTDGAAVLILVSGDYLKRNNLTPLAKFISFSVCGVSPALMGIGPIPAIKKLLNKTGLNLSHIDKIELNEAFAAQSLAVIQELGLDLNRVNPNGGAIALGHPLGATGSVLAIKLLYGLRRDRQKYGIVSMCVGGGMGAAGLFEACY